MKVYIGPHTEWVGPHQIADRVLFWLDPAPIDDKELERPIYKFYDKLVDFLAGPFVKGNHRGWVMRFCEWVESHKHRTEYVKLDRYDHWNANTTIALITLPLLKKLKETKHGSPHVDIGDVPEQLWPKQLAGPSNYYTDDTAHERWEWVLDEMIWAFEQEIDVDDESQFYDHSESKNEEDDLQTQIDKIKIDREGLEMHQQRKANGFRLFGRYYQGLWD